MEKRIVTMPSADIRRLARQGLSGNWKTPVLAILLQNVVLVAPLVLMVGFFLSGASSWLGNLYTFLVGAPLNLGLMMLILNVFRRKPASPVEIFYGFEYLVKAIALSFFIGLFTVLWTLLFIIPGFVAAYRYSLAFYLLADDPGKGVFQCINESKFLMDGNKAKAFWLDFSFIGWYLLCSIPVGVFTSFVTYQNFDFIASYQVNPALGFYDFIEQKPLLNILYYITLIGFLWLESYTYTSRACLYDLISGNLTVRRVSVEESGIYNTVEPDGPASAEGGSIRPEDLPFGGGAETHPGGSEASENRPEMGEGRIATPGQRESAPDGRDTGGEAEPFGSPEENGGDGGALGEGETEEWETGASGEGEAWEDGNRPKE